MIRLDFFLVSDTLLEVIKGETILPGYRSDHSIITIKLCFDKTERGRGFWKFNNSLLKDPTCIQKVKDAIFKVKRQYAPIPYNREIISNIENHDFQPILNDQLFFEMLLLEIITTSINYAKRKKRDDSLIIKKVEEDIKNSRKHN